MRLCSRPPVIESDSSKKQLVSRNRITDTGAASHSHKSEQQGVSAHPHGPPPVTVQHGQSTGARFAAGNNDQIGQKVQANLLRTTLIAALEAVALDVLAARQRRTPAPAPAPE